jgi:hypothetical protein
MESLLEQSVKDVPTHKPVAIKAGRRKMATKIKSVVLLPSELRCAGDVLRFGELMGWL